MKIAVMQPYIFPYIGYFQLIKYADAFVFYDDVDFIKQGWVNRNQILANKRPLMFTLPLENASSFTLIKDTKLHSRLYEKWTGKFFKTLEQNYKNAPYYHVVSPLIIEVFLNQVNISEIAVDSIKMVSRYLNLDTQFFLSSDSFSKYNEMTRTNRLIAITKELNGDLYVNMIGGKDLYAKKDFAEKGIKLEFFQSRLVKYAQAGNEFHPGLSIIDVMMNCNKKEILNLLGQFEII